MTVVYLDVYMEDRTALWCARARVCVCVNKQNHSQSLHTYLKCNVFPWNERSLFLCQRARAYTDNHGNATYITLCKQATVVLYIHKKRTKRQERHHSDWYGFCKCFLFHCASYSVIVPLSEITMALYVIIILLVNIHYTLFLLLNTMFCQRNLSFSDIIK